MLDFVRNSLFGVYFYGMNMIYFLQVIHFAFLAYTILLFVRILTSWVPSWQGQTWVRFISFYTDPYLNLFRRLIPPLGGTIDLSPMLAFFGLRILESILLWIIR